MSNQTFLRSKLDALYEEQTEPHQDIIKGIVEKHVGKVERQITQLISGSDESEQPLEFDAEKRNDSVEKIEKATLKKALQKEMRLFRLGEPNMRKKEYHEKLKKIQEIDLPQEEDEVDGSRNTPRALLRKMLFVTAASPDESAENSLILYRGGSTLSQSRVISHQQLAQRRRQLPQQTYLTEITNFESIEAPSIGEEATSRGYHHSPQPSTSVPSSLSQQLPHSEFVKKMKVLKKQQLQKQLQAIQREEQQLLEEKYRQEEFERNLKEQRERSLEEWRQYTYSHTNKPALPLFQVQQRIDEQKLRRQRSQEPLKSLYSKNPSIIVTGHIKKKQPPLYVILNQQFEQQKQAEERLIQEKLRTIKEQKKPIRLEEIRQHEQSLERAAQARRDELKNKRQDAYLSHIQNVNHRQLQTDMNEGITFIFIKQIQFL